MQKFIRFMLPVVVVALCFLVAKWLIGTKKKPERHQHKRPTTIVDAMRLQKKDYQVILHSTGTVQPRTESTLIAEVAGQIVMVSPNFREGGFFQKGEVLVSIEDRVYRAAVTVAESDLLSAKLALEQEKIRVANYESDRITAESELALAQLEIVEEEARSRQAEQDWYRSFPDKEADDLVLRRPQLNRAKAALQAAEAKIQEVKRNIELGPQEIEVAKGSVAAAEARLDEKRLDLERTKIVAPFFGRVLEKSVDIGQYVSPGNVITNIYAVDYVEISLPLANRQLEYIDLLEHFRGGSDSQDSLLLNVTIKAKIGRRDYSWPGKIVRSVGAIDTQSRQLSVVAKVESPYNPRTTGNPPLRVGQFVEAEISGKKLIDIFVIPQTAFRENNYVWVIKNENQLYRKKVEPIWSDAGNVVIRDGLTSGELLCVTTVPYAIDGATVRPRIDGKVLGEADPDRQSKVKTGHPRHHGGSR